MQILIRAKKSINDMIDRYVDNRGYDNYIMRCRELIYEYESLMQTHGDRDARLIAIEHQIIEEFGLNLR